MTFEKELSARIGRILAIPKVTFDHPGESNEQECVFIEIQKADIRVKDARQIAKVQGIVHVFAESEKLPIGYFAKKFSAAAAADTKGFFFGTEETVEKFRNVAERKFDFMFLFDSQYDPAIGTITSLNLS